MATYTRVDLPLYSDAFYSYQVSLEGQGYIVEIKYNERAETWYMSLFDQDNNPIVQGIALVPRFPILKDYVIPNITGFFWLAPIPSVKTEKYKENPEHLDQYYVLQYIYNFVE